MKDTDKLVAELRACARITRAAGFAATAQAMDRLADGFARCGEGAGRPAAPQPAS